MFEKIAVSGTEIANLIAKKQKVRYKNIWITEIRIVHVQ